MEAQPNAASAFLTALFGNVSPSLWFYLWTDRGRESAWYHATTEGIAAASRHIAERMQDRNVYVGVALHNEEHGINSRGTAQKTAGIVGLWVDLDISDPVHKKDNLPTTITQVEEMLDRFGPAPSIILHTGHGLQAWWLFREPWIFDSAQDQATAGNFVKRFQDTLRSLSGWAIDATHDLSRVLRVPGSFNVKAEPVPVRTISLTESRYAPGDLEAFFISDLEIRRAQQRAAGNYDGSKQADVPPAPVVDANGLRIDPQAPAPADKMLDLMDIDPRFKATLNRQRKDFKDSSPSSYDMALAIACAGAGWTDQEIVDLIIFSRRKNGEDLKMHGKYYATTIDKARAVVQRHRAIEGFEEVIEEHEEAQATGTPEDVETTRATLLATVSAMLTVTITRMVRHTASPPGYRMILPQGSVFLGKSETLMSQQQMRARLFDMTGVVIPRIKAEKWDNIVAALGKACVDESIGDEATETGLANSWVQDYMSDRKPLPEEEQQKAATEKQPYMKDGAIYIFGEDLRNWLRVHRQETVGPRDMGFALRAYGALPEQCGIALPGGLRSTRGVWRLPAPSSHEAPDGGSAGDGERQARENSA